MSSSKSDASINSSKMGLIFGVSAETVRNWQKPDSKGLVILTNVGFANRGRSKSYAYTANHIIEVLEKIYFSNRTPESGLEQTQNILERIQEEDNLPLPAAFKKETLQKLESFLADQTPDK